MCKPKAVIYPYDNESSFLFKYNQLNVKFDAVGAVAPKGWGFTDKDIGEISGGEQIGVKVKSSFKHCCEYFDTIVIVDSYMELDFNIVYDAIIEEVKKGKNLICLKKLKEKDYQSLLDICKSSDSNFEYFKGNEWAIDSSTFSENLLDLKVPIIFIVGVAQRTGKFDLQLALSKEIQKYGYRVSQIGTKNFSEVFGFHSFPDFIFSSTINETIKILMFNRYVKTIELNEKPDVVIIGIPGGILPINKEFTENFGIYAYLVSQAVKPDMAILSVLYEDYLPEYFREIDNLCKYKFGYKVDCFNLSNVKFDYQLSNESGEKCYSVIDTSFINEKVKKYDIYEKPVFNALNSMDMDKLSNYVIDSLSGGTSIKDII